MKYVKVNWFDETGYSQKEDNNKGFIYGIYSYRKDDPSPIYVEWFKTKVKRNSEFNSLVINQKLITKPKGKKGWKQLTKDQKLSRLMSALKDGQKGWKSESVRHSLARKGIKTGRKKR